MMTIVNTTVLYNRNKPGEWNLSILTKKEKKGKVKLKPNGPDVGHSKDF